MHPILARTVGGLLPSAYIRHFLFGLLFPAIAYAALSSRSTPSPWHMYAIFAVNSLLYPYARHAYETIVEFILGNNVIFANLGFVLFVKIFTMLLCWGFAVVVAPLGLLFIYFQTGKVAKAEQQEP